MQWDDEQATYNQEEMKVFVNSSTSKTSRKWYWQANLDLGKHLHCLTVQCATYEILNPLSLLVLDESQ